MRNATWMIDVLGDLASFAHENGIESSEAALKFAQQVVANEVRARQNIKSDFPKKGDNFVLICSDE